jgi:hypothetical protein
MNSKINRRNFIKKGSIIGLGSYIGLSLMAKKTLANLFSIHPGIAVVNGKDYFNGTKKAIDILGGMSEFVKEGQKVGLLINSDFTEKGAYVNPDISLAVIEECIKAGSNELVCLQNVKDEYWKRSNHYDSLSPKFSKLKSIQVRSSLL